MDVDHDERLDCLLIGHNETPFASYESLIAKYGEDSEAYRDLKLSFVEIAGRKMTYVDLLNQVWRASRGLPETGGVETFRSGDIPHLAAVYLTHFLRRRGFRADWINLFQEEKERLVEILRHNPPRAVAITTTLYLLNFPASEIIELVRAHAPQTLVVIGGPLIANHNRNYQGKDLDLALADLGADVYVVEAQGELTLARVVETLRRGGDLREVPNLVLPESGGLHRTKVEPESNDLDENAIDWRLLADHELGATLQTRTARSCAFKCSFCNYPTRAGKLTLAGLETLEREFDAMKATGDVRNVVFIDDTFNVPLPRFKDICRLLIERRYGFKWFSYFRCSNTDEEVFDLMAESGCAGVFLGIESGSNRVLEAMNKRATIHKYEEGIRRLRANGILTFGSFIIGHPGETAETVDETLDFIRSTRPDYYRAQLWYNEPGTPIHAQKETYDIEGDGFVWSHKTMDSLEAMEHIERLFLTIEESTWLPQWSFDFWIIPYLLGRGLSLEEFGFQMKKAHQLLTLNVASVDPQERETLAQQHLAEMVAASRSWRLGVTELAFSS